MSMPGMGEWLIILIIVVTLIGTGLLQGKLFGLDRQQIAWVVLGMLFCGPGGIVLALALWGWNRRTRPSP